jgi:hypothetical protein
VITACPKPREQSNGANSGVPGAGGLAPMTTFADGDEVQLDAFVTVNVYVPGSRPETVVLVPLEAVVIPPGLRVRTQEPAGSEFRTTLPVDRAHVGEVIVPTDGAAGVRRGAVITAGADAGEGHPFVPATVKVYEPSVNAVIIVVDPDPVEVAPPGLIVTVHVPAGKPLSATLPVATEHVGCVIVPIVGAVGPNGCAGITTSSDNDAETHPASLVIEKL